MPQTKEAVPWLQDRTQSNETPQSMLLNGGVIQGFVYTLSSKIIYDRHLDFAHKLSTNGLIEPIF